MKKYQEELRRQQREGKFDFGQGMVLESEADASRLSEMEIPTDGGGASALMFSTPVRASFRQRHLLHRSNVLQQQQQRRSLMEAARTPLKSDGGGRLRPREVKRRSGEGRVDFPSFHPDPDVAGHDASDLPSCIEPSMVAVCSRFLNYEATLPTDISAVLTPEVAASKGGDEVDLGDPRNLSYSNSVRQLLLAGESSRKNRQQQQQPGTELANSLILDRNLIFLSSFSELLRDHSHQQPFHHYDEASDDLTRLSLLPSLAADGTETRLMVESMNRTRQKGISESNNGYIFGPPGIDQSTLVASPQAAASASAATPVKESDKVRG